MGIDVPASVTVITPVFNGGSFVAETIESVLAQSYPALEYIVLDDGSTDRTAEVLRGFGERIRVISHPNMGETKTVNKGFGLARGEFVAVVNADDPLRPGALAALVQAARADPSAMLAYSDWEEIDEVSRVLRRISLPQYDLREMLQTFNVAMGPGVLIRSAALQQAGLRDSGLKYTGDLDLWFRLAMIGPFVHVPTVLATHRVHPASASVSHRGARMAEEVARLAQKSCSDPHLPEDLRGQRSFILAQGHFVASLYCGSDLPARLRHLRSSIGSAPGSFALIWGKYLWYRALSCVPEGLRAAVKGRPRRAG